MKIHILKYKSIFILKNIRNFIKNKVEIRYRDNIDNIYQSIEYKEHIKCH